MRNGSAASSKTGLFLMEIIIMLLFFALCAAVCMRMFGAAQANSDYSRDLSEASLWAQSAAECYKAAQGDLEEAAELLGLPEEAFVLGAAGASDASDTSDDGAASEAEAAADTEDRALTVFYDNAWEPAAGSTEAAYILTLAEREAEMGPGGAEITITKSGEEEALFAIQVKAVMLHGN